MLCQPPVPEGYRGWSSPRAAGIPLVIRETQGEMEQAVHSRSYRARKGSTAGSRTSLKAVSSCGTQLRCMCSLGWSPAARSENNLCWKGPLEVSSLVLFSRQDQEGHITQSFSGWVLKAFKDGNPTAFQSPHPTVWPPSWWKDVSIYLIRIPHVLICVCGLLSLPGHLWGESGAAFLKSSFAVSSPEHCSSLMLCAF